MTPNNSPDSSHGDDPVKLPDDLRALEADLRLLEPRAFQPPSAIRPTPQLPAGPLAFANTGNRTTFAAGLVLGSPLGVAVTILFVGANRRSDPVLARNDLQPGSVERSSAELETSTPHVAREESQIASLSLLGIAQFFSPAAENDDLQLSESTDQSLTASTYSWESLLTEDVAKPKFRFAKNESTRKTVFELQKELLGSF